MWQELRSDFAEVALGLKLTLWVFFVFGWAIGGLWSLFYLLRFADVDWLHSPLAWGLGLAFMIPASFGMVARDIANTIKNHGRKKPSNSHHD